MGSHLILPGSHLGQMKNFHTNTYEQVGQSSKVGIEFSLISFVFFVFVVVVFRC